MARTLTDPIIPPPLPPRTQQAITHIQFSIPHSWDPVEGMLLERSAISVLYKVNTFDAEGNSTESLSTAVIFADWTPSFKLSVKDIYNKITAHAVQQDLMQPGVDEEL